MKIEGRSIASAKYSSLFRCEVRRLRFHYHYIRCIVVLCQSHDMQYKAWMRWWSRRKRWLSRLFPHRRSRGICQHRHMFYIEYTLSCSDDLYAYASPFLRDKRSHLRRRIKARANLHIFVTMQWSFIAHCQLADALFLFTNEEGDTKSIQVCSKHNTYQQKKEYFPLLFTTRESSFSPHRKVKAHIKINRDEYSINEYSLNECIDKLRRVKRHLSCC